MFNKLMWQSSFRIGEGCTVWLLKKITVKLFHKIILRKSFIGFFCRFGLSAVFIWVCCWCVYLRITIKMHLQYICHTPRPASDYGGIHLHVDGKVSLDELYMSIKSKIIYWNIWLISIQVFLYIYVFHLSFHTCHMIEEMLDYLETNMYL